VLAGLRHQRRLDASARYGRRCCLRRRLLLRRKTLDSLAPIAAVLRKLAGIERVVVVPYVSAAPDLTRVPGAQLLADFEREAPLEFARRPFDAPLYIMYSSGTTGVPKCICTGSAARCCSTQGSTCCTSTSNTTTGCSSSRPAAG